MNSEYCDFQNKDKYINLLIIKSRCHDKDPPHAPYHPFHYKAMLGAHDIPSVRRGYEVINMHYCTDLIFVVVKLFNISFSASL